MGSLAVGRERTNEAGVMVPFLICTRSPGNQTFSCPGLQDKEEPHRLFQTFLQPVSSLAKITSRICKESQKFFWATAPAHSPLRGEMKRIMIMRGESRWHGFDQSLLEWVVFPALLLCGSGGGFSSHLGTSLLGYGHAKYMRPLRWV